jgi:creatinine amidohydrolase
MDAKNERGFDMQRKLGRRDFLGTAAATALLGTNSKGQEQKETQREVRLEYLRPKELKESQAACPTIFQPLGTIEWHGVHNVVGVDSLKAHALCVRAAQKGGGLVAPTLYGGVGGVSQPHTFVMDPENNIFSKLLRPWLEQLCREMVVRETAVRMSRALAIPVLGTPEYLLALDVDYTGDHAAWGETSLMMHLYPDTVDLSQLGEAPHQGVGGRDPKKEASAEDGRILAETIVSRLAVLAEKMPTWDDKTLERFIDSEAALVARQLSAPKGKNNLWTAWRNIGGAMRNYGRQLAEGRFEEIKASVAGL